MRYLLLLLLSSQAFAHTSMPPSFEIFTQQLLMLSPDTLRADGSFAYHENGGVITALTLTSSVDFGDGESISGNTNGVRATHTYAQGSFVAVMTLSAIGEWRDTTSFTINGQPPTILPINFNFTKSLAVNVVSHMPEPTTYAMLLMGLGFIGLRRKYGNKDMRMREDVDAR